jgi:metallo-beta-lactamase class B
MGSLSGRPEAPTLKIYLHRAALLASLFLCAASPNAQPSAVNPPTAITPAAQSHFDAARRAAGSDFLGGLRQCNSALPRDQRLDLPTSAQLLGGGDPGDLIEPARVFDNLYFVGIRHVASWAVVTSGGIIVIDALDNGKEASSVIEGGLRKLGLDPEQIKYVIVTHGHGDHYGGAKYLAQKRHARVLMSALDYELAKAPPDQPIFDPPPVRDRIVSDGQKLTLGAETLTLYLTPGHTLGTVSILIPVRDHGQPHVVALWGGAGFNFPHSAERYEMYAQSALRFSQLALAAGADVPLSNHPDQDSAVIKMEKLKQRRPDEANPFVMGADAVRRFLTTYAECAQTHAAQMAAGYGE